MPKYGNICKKSGFSLTELVIAVGLLCVVIVTICGVFMHGLEAIKKGKYRASALHIANQKYAELNNDDWSDPNGLPTDKLSVAPPDGYIDGFTSCDPNTMSFIGWDVTPPPYKISGKQTMADVEYDFVITIESYRQNLKKVRVKVTWPEAGVKRNLELCTFIARRY